MEVNEIDKEFGSICEIIGLEDERVKCLGIDYNPKYIVCADNEGNVVAIWKLISEVRYEGTVKKVRKLKGLSLCGIDEEFMRNTIRDLVGYARSNGMVIAIEDIKQGEWFFMMLVEEANRKDVEVIRVSPNGTSRICSRCGHYSHKVRKMFRCEWCGLVIDKDVNSAINIAKRGVKIIGDRNDRIFERDCEKPAD